jgi:prevent-host-death family protein
MQVNVHQAKTQLSQLLAAVEAGEEVVIARRGVPVARMVPAGAPKGSGVVFGIWKDRLKGPMPDFLEPMDEEDLRLWEGHGD